MPKPCHPAKVVEPAHQARSPETDAGPDIYYPSMENIFPNSLQFFQCFPRFRDDSRIRGKNLSASKPSLFKSRGRLAFVD
ncbi:MAG: hypothetical protein DRO11_02540 [Methanobacteriota archaeon]|nr:MAG: hypothetical protein DRO11_02540 [Euryarchaeota archaeon]